MPQIHVLLVEDDPVSARFVHESLLALGCTVTQATNGMTALECARQHTFQQLICDLGLPDIDGFSLLSRLRADPGAASASVRAVAMSAEVSPSIARRARLAGFAQLLTKPLNRNGLAQALHLSPLDHPPAQGTPAHPAGDDPDFDDQQAVTALGF